MRMRTALLLVVVAFATGCPDHRYEDYDFSAPRMFETPPPASFVVDPQGAVTAVYGDSNAWTVFSAVRSAGVWSRFVVTNAVLIDLLPAPHPDAQGEVQGLLVQQGYRAPPAWSFFHGNRNAWSFEAFPPGPFWSFDGAAIAVGPGGDPSVFFFGYDPTTAYSGDLRRLYVAHREASGWRTVTAPVTDPDRTLEVRGLVDPAGGLHVFTVDPMGTFIHYVETPTGWVSSMSVLATDAVWGTALHVATGPAGTLRACKGPFYGEEGPAGWTWTHLDQGLWCLDVGTLQDGAGYLVMVGVGTELLLTENGDPTRPWTVTELGRMAELDQADQGFLVTESPLRVETLRYAPLSPDGSLHLEYGRWEAGTLEWEVLDR